MSSEFKNTGAVIKIIDEYRIAINLGKDVVKTDDYVYIYDKNNSIKDLDGTELGTYDVCKAKLIVYEVYDNFSICGSITSSIDQFAFTNTTLALSPILAVDKKREKLNIDPDLINKINKKDKAIRIGDIVKL